MNKENESPYCEICGTCGCIGCCGIQNFISEHIEGKTNCKNESWIIQDLIDLCDYKDKVFEENKRLNNIIDELEKYVIEMSDRSWDDNGAYNDVLDKLKELKNK